MPSWSSIFTLSKFCCQSLILAPFPTFTYLSRSLYFLLIYFTSILSFLHNFLSFFPINSLSLYPTYMYIIFLFPIGTLSLFLIHFSSLSSHTSTSFIRTYLSLSLFLSLSLSHTHTLQPFSYLHICNCLYFFLSLSHTHTSLLSGCSLLFTLLSFWIYGQTFRTKNSPLLIKQWQINRRYERVFCSINGWTAEQGSYLLQLALQLFKHFSFAQTDSNLPIQTETQFAFFFNEIFNDFAHNILVALLNFFLKKWANPGLFFVYFRSFQVNQYNFYNKSMRKNVYPVYGTGIRTHDLLNMSRFYLLHFLQGWKRYDEYKLQ